MLKGKKNGLRFSLPHKITVATINYQIIWGKSPACPTSPPESTFSKEGDLLLKSIDVTHPIFA
jgi:hypothetical protein